MMCIGQGMPSPTMLGAHLVVIGVRRGAKTGRRGELSNNKPLDPRFRDFAIDRDARRAAGPSCLFTAPIDIGCEGIATPSLVHP
jgi:hypothetical protein